MSDHQPEPWLRGAIPHVPDLLQPVAHALIHSRENIAEVVEPLTQAQVWESKGGAASVGYHLRHLAGSTDRLLTYALGMDLKEEQRTRLAMENDEAPNQVGIEVLLNEWSAVVEAFLNQLKMISENDLKDVRYVGRSRLKSTVLGLLFHAAEHASRHTGQIVTTAIIVKASSSAI